MASPLRYKEKFSEDLVNHMAQGNSFSSFGSIIGVSYKTLSRWTKKYPEFQEAKEIGESHELAYWENLLKRGASGDLPPVRKRITVLDGDSKTVKQITVIDEPGRVNSAAMIFAMKNKFPRSYRDSYQIEESKPDSLENLSDEELKRRRELYAAVLAGKEIPE